MKPDHAGYRKQINDHDINQTRYYCPKWKGGFLLLRKHKGNLLDLGSLDSLYLCIVNHESCHLIILRLRLSLTSYMYLGVLNGASHEVASAVEGLASALDACLIC